VRTGERVARARRSCYDGDVASSDETPEHASTDDPAAIADDGMAPLINNTGADADADDDADASSG
jgi:hypothetical protein